MDDVSSGERQLVARARRGDPDAWELVYRRAYPRLIAYARRRLSTHDQAEEAVSETMTRAMVHIGRYHPGAAGLQGWLFGIARNVVLEAHRARVRQLPVEPDVLAERAGVADAGPEQEVLAAEERLLLAAAFDRLSTQDQDVLELRVLSGLDAEQVGALTGRRPGAVRMAQSRALARLRAELEGQRA